MSKKIVKIGGQAVEDIQVEINGKRYNVPLAKAMKRKELLAMKTEDDVYQMFARHIPAEVLDDLTVEEYNQLCNAWAEANDDGDGESLGE
jgi:hypothetical protein